MKKANIITLNGYRNYGNRLQNFALTLVLKRMGVEVRTVWNRGLKETIITKIKHLPFFSSKYPKEHKLYNFTRIYNSSAIPFSNPDYTIYGSDQVWNPNSVKTNKYLLEKKKDKSIQVSYAASMGVQDLTKSQREQYKKALSDYGSISVREISAKNLLQSLIPKNTIEVVLDPTLLLGKSEYEKIEKRPKNLIENDKYILCYILGNRDHEEIIEKFAKEKGYKTIYFSDKRDSDYGVEEFLYLIHHAQLVCTDSFHACVFSFIFERPFVAFKRTGEANYMYTRLQNLIETFQLKNREYNGKEITKENLEVDYTEAKKILKKEQKKSLDFLKRALDIKGNE